MQERVNLFPCNRVFRVVILLGRYLNISSMALMASPLV